MKKFGLVMAAVLLSGCGTSAGTTSILFGVYARVLNANFKLSLNSDHTYEEDTAVVAGCDGVEKGTFTNTDKELTYSMLKDSCSTTTATTPTHVTTCSYSFSDANSLAITCPGLPAPIAYTRQ